MYRRLKSAYGDDAVNESNVNRWVIQFCGCKPGKVLIVLGCSSSFCQEPAPYIFLGT